MSALYVDFSWDDNVISSIQKAKNSLNSRINDYNGITRDLNSIYSNTGNLYNANSYLRKKITNLEGKRDRLNRFESQISSFNSIAENADRLVANRINTETNTFYKHEGLPNGIIYSIGCLLSDTWEWIKEVEEKKQEILRSLWNDIKKWYNDNKHWIDIVIDAVIVVAEVVAAVTAVTALIAATAVGITAVLGAAISLFFATWGAVTSSAELIYDSQAYVYHQYGMEDKYEDYSNRDFGDQMEEWWPGVGGYLYDGIEIASCIYDITEIATTGYKAYTNYQTAATKYSDILSPDTIQQIKISNIKDAIFKAAGITNLDPATGQNNLENIVNTAKWGAKLFDNLMNNDTGTASIKTIKIANTIKKICDGGKSIYDRATAVDDEIGILLTPPPLPSLPLVKTTIAA